MSIQSMPQTEELCMAAVKKDGMVLGYLDDLDKTPEICREAVKQNREAIQFVPPALRDEVLQPYRDKRNYKVSGFATSQFPSTLPNFASTLPDELKHTKETPGVKPGVIPSFFGGKSRTRRKRKRTKRYWNVESVRKNKYR